MSDNPSGNCVVVANAGGDDDPAATAAEDTLLPEIPEDDIRTLVKRSKEAMQFAYNVYSRFSVGAALLTASGQIYTGCNIENASYSLTSCAERTAIFKAVSEGHRKFKAIAVSSSADVFISPCGACRQVLIEFGHFHVYLSKPDSTWRHTTTHELLPHIFVPETLLSYQKSIADK